MQNEEMGEQQQPGRHRRYPKRNNVLAGFLLLVAGGVLLIRQVEYDLIPRWLFTWPMILIIVGLFVGVQTKFRDFGWLIIFGIGAFFLVDHLSPGYDAGRFIVPVVIIGVGLIVLLSPNKKKWKDKKETAYLEVEAIGSGAPKADVLDVTSIFGNVKKTIYSKDFKGGEIVSIFGGAEINLSQADIKGPIVLEIVQIFGGTKLIVPPHWEIRSETTAILGGIEDKRPPQSVTSPDKVLILQGTAIFAGIEIKSY
jgi:predicted membrane protein